MKTQFNLASLSLIGDIAKQHSFRAFLQIISWYGSLMNTTDCDSYGRGAVWEIIQKLPVNTNDEAAPELLFMHKYNSMQSWLMLMKENGVKLHISIVKVHRAQIPPKEEEEKY